MSLIRHSAVLLVLLPLIAACGDSTGETAPMPSNADPAEENPGGNAGAVAQTDTPSPDGGEFGEEEAAPTLTAEPEDLIIETQGFAPTPIDNAEGFAPEPTRPEPFDPAPVFDTQPEVSTTPQ